MAEQFYHGKPCRHGHGTLRYKVNRNCVECTNNKSRAWQESNYDKVRESWRKHDLKRKFGITHEQYQAMLTEQKGVCAICGKPPRGRRLAVDHDHKTGAIRALLCGNCNHVLGNGQDDPEILRKAADYLEQHRSKGK